MKILFFGDIVGRLGREAIKKHLPDIKKKFRPDFILANAENLAHGSGISEKTIREMQTAGIDFFTAGNHILDNKNGLAYLKKNNAPIVVPANLDADCPGQIYQIITIKRTKILIINLLGQVFINKKTNSPFKTADLILAATKKEKPNIILVDIHAEATSEKQALWYYLDGRVSAVLGTHTHVATANPRISKKGTTLVEDIGMVGAQDAVLGDKKENVLERFLTGQKVPLEPAEKGPVIINGVLLDINNQTGRVSCITRVDQAIK